MIKLKSYILVFYSPALLSQWTLLLTSSPEEFLNLQATQWNNSMDESYNIKLIGEKVKMRLCFMTTL